MKKTLIFLGVILTISLFAFFNKVQGEDLDLAAVTTSIVPYDFEENVYYYTDYLDLINQIKADISDDVYDQIYSEVIDELTEACYEEIYDSVEEKLVDLLSIDELKIYLDTFQQKFHDVVEIAENSVFGVMNTVSSEEMYIGSGVVYKYDSEADLYYLITNQHVVDSGASFEIYFADETTVEATVIGYDTEVDIAVLTFSGQGLENIQVSVLGDSNQNEVSEFVLAFGNPNGFSFYNSVTMGIISGIDRKVDSDRYVDYIQHDVAINSGNSGGPIYNLDGEVIGINVIKFAAVDIEGMGFAIPINLVKQVIERIEADDLLELTIMPRLGSTYYVVQDEIDGTNVLLDSLTIDGTKELDLNILLPTGVTSGIIVDDIDALGSIDGILENGDLIFKFNEFIITDKTSFQDYLYENFESGDLVILSYYDFNHDTNAYSNTLSQVVVKLK
jgi:S1-C subfamily serine protease